MEEDKKSNGALVGAVIVILILILGGVYLWTSNSLNDNEGSPVNEEQQVPVNIETSAEGQLIIEADTLSQDIDSVPTADMSDEINNLE